MDIFRRALTVEHLKNNHHEDKESGKYVSVAVDGDVDI